MLSLALLSMALFVSIDRTDPITDAHQIALLAENDGSTIVIGSQKPNTVEIALELRDYVAPSKSAMLLPSIDYRFGTSPAKTGFWTFGADMIRVSSAREKADFIDQLARNDVIHLRFGGWTGHYSTISFSYQLSLSQLRTVLTRCAPEKVIEILRAQESPSVDR